MRLEQFEYLNSIKKHHSMHAAARELLVSQQCISKAMKDLEEELNIKILYRNNTGTYFTDEGQDVYLHAKKIIDEVNILKNKYGDSSKTAGNVLLSNKILKIFISYSISDIIAEDIYRFNAIFDSKINIIEMDTLGIINRLENSNDIELAILQIPVSDLQKNNYIKEQFSCYILAKERLNVVMNKHSEFALMTSISQKTLQNIPLIVASDSLDNLPIYAQLLVNKGIKLNIRYITTSRSINKYLNDNIVCALGTASNLNALNNTANICAVPIKDKVYIETCLLVRKSNLSDISNAFVKQIMIQTKEKVF